MASTKGSAEKRKRVAAESGALRKKRRAQSESSNSDASASASDSDSEGDSGADGNEDILLLENEIVESKKNYNNIAKLIQLAQDPTKDAARAIVAAVSLCRVFIRLLSLGDMAKAKDGPKKQALVVRQLRDWMSDFSTALLAMLKREESALTALTLSMRMWKAAADRLGDADTVPAELFKKTVLALLQPGVDAQVRDEFIEKFMGPHDDVRFYTFRSIE